MVAATIGEPLSETGDGGPKYMNHSILAPILR